MNAKQRVQVPFGLKKKLMAATSMLLVAAIMLVSTSYAWFTLSTAPEITGITTSVGANGNLEIALLNNETYDSPDTEITSNAGDSMDVDGKPVTAANITWGNLIDLSDESYGLNRVTMYPSALNMANGILNNQPLATPTYGADGRVKALTANTSMAIFDGTSFAIDGNGHGVRAVGVSSNITPRQLAYDTASSNFSQNARGAQSATKGAVEANLETLLSLAAGTATTYTTEELAAMKNMVAGVDTSLKNIVTAYANAMVAYYATTTDDEAAITAASTALSNVTSAAKLKTLLSSVNESAAAIVRDELDTLEKAQTDVSNALTYVETANETTDASEVNANVIVPLVGGTSSIQVIGKDGNPVTVSASNITALMQAKEAYLSGGAINTVATYTGKFQVTSYGNLKVFAGAKETATTGKLSAVNIPDFTDNGTAAANITDFYGYVVDFAFRTNATDSNLQLQTEAANRVYSDATAESGKTLATQGSGSNGTFNYNGLTYEQGKNLLLSYRVLFFDPADGTVFATAMFDPDTVTAKDTAETTKTISADMKLTTVDEKYTLGKDAYAVSEYTAKTSLVVDSTTINPANIADDAAATLTVDEYNALKNFTTGVTTGEGDTAVTTYTLGKDAYEASKYKVVTTGDADAEKVVVKINGTNVEMSDTNCNTYEAELDAAAYELLAAKTGIVEGISGGEQITALNQNVATKVSMLVYLDGSNIDNADVNASGTSGSLKLNVQFSSSANLVPMENAALKKAVVESNG